MRPLDPRLLRYARRAAVQIAVLAAIGAVTAGLVIAQAQLLATAIAGRTAAVLAPLAAVVAARALAAWAAEATAHRASAAAKSELRRRLLARVVRLGPGWRRTRRTAELTELATQGIDALDGYFTGYLPKLILAVAVPLTVLAAITAADPVSGVVVAVTLPLVPLFGALIGLATGRHAKKRWRALGMLAHHFLDVVTGLPTLKVFGRARAQREQIAKVTGSYRRATMATLRLAFLSSFALELIATMSVALVATEIGLRLAYGHLGLRTGLLVLILAPEAYLPLRAVGAQFHATADGLTAAEEVFGILETEAPAAVPAGPITARGGSPRPITVDGVTVYHDGRPDPAPREATLTIVPGRLTVLTGPSGCGKSTLLSCILGLTEPSAGTVQPRLIPNESGWLPQDPTLFAGTVAANIRLGWPGAPPEAVELAARQAALDDVPLDTSVGERGTGLSAGQRRRVALARALLVRRPVLLLDEPTAGLDAAREATVLRTLRDYADAGRAVLAVSHHPAVISAADEVVVLGAPAGARAPAGVPAGVSA
jgi:ATP-binding cassette subfamily C protein CydCD